MGRRWGIDGDIDGDIGGDIDVGIGKDIGKRNQRTASPILTGPGERMVTKAR